MPRFQTKRVVIEAMLFTADTQREVLRFIGSRWWEQPSEYEPAGLVGNGNGDDFIAIGLWVKTLEGTMNASVGDWIIKGLKGEFYPCKPDVFAMKYEPAAGHQEPT